MECDANRAKITILFRSRREQSEAHRRGQGDGVHGVRRAACPEEQRWNATRIVRKLLSFSVRGANSPRRTAGGKATAYMAYAEPHALRSNDGMRRESSEKVSWQDPTVRFLVPRSVAGTRK